MVCTGYLGILFLRNAGPDMSPHKVRCALATYGEHHPGFRVDHLEGVDPNNVNGQFFRQTAD
jgi:hypothetical protein